MHINDLLAMAVERGASDLHLKVASHPMLRINGELFLQEDIAVITPADMDIIFSQVTTPPQRERFTTELEVDFAYYAKGAGRFRINICLQDGTIGLSCRPVLTQIPTIDGLGLPSICRDLALKSSGLVIITGPTGCGKSTTLAAMMDYLNRGYKRKIITIEDPVEYQHRDNKCIFSQREIGRDTHSFANALKHAMRQDPDVILVGEMRDLETMSAVLTAAETGHLVLTTLHTPGAPQAIDRFIDIFPPHQQQQVRIQLSSVLEGIIYQLLVPGAHGGGRVPAFEIMLTTPAIRNLVRENKTHQMMTAMQTGARDGMVTLNQCLSDLFLRGVITKEEALAHSIELEELKELIGGHQVQK
jgi:twitching motility protein PilT